MSATVYLTFPMDDAEGDLTFSGVAGDGNPFGLLSMNEPARPKRRTFAEGSPHVAGGLVTQSVGDMTDLRASVLLEASSQVELETRKVRMRAVLERLTFECLQVINGVTTAYSGVAADIAPDGDLDLNDLEGFAAAYTLTIPVQPLGA